MIIERHTMLLLMCRKKMSGALLAPCHVRFRCVLLALMFNFSFYWASVYAGTLYQAEYQYDQRGMVTNLTESYAGGPEEVRSLDYDSLGRMIYEKLGLHEVSFQYDRLGNRLRQVHPTEEKSFQYNSRNELVRQVLQASTYELSYDANGSLTQKVVGAASTRYEWDSRGRLTGVWTNDVEVFSASYSGDLTRQKKQEGAASKTYRHDGVTAIEEVDGLGDVKELVRRDRGEATMGGVLYSANKEGTNTYTYNGVGSTVVLSGEDGLARGVKYDAFGNILEADQGVDTERLANTKELDPSTGLYFHGARYYDVETGRYISLDPMRDGINHYIYANNAPLTFVDPTGTVAAYIAGVAAFTYAVGYLGIWAVDASEGRGAPSLNPMRWFGPYHELGLQPVPTRVEQNAMAAKYDPLWPQHLEREREKRDTVRKARKQRVRDCKEDPHCSLNNLPKKLTPEQYRREYEAGRIPAHRPMTSLEATKQEAYELGRIMYPPKGGGGAPPTKLAPPSLRAKYYGEGGHERAGSGSSGGLGPAPDGYWDEYEKKQKDDEEVADIRYVAGEILSHIRSWSIAERRRRNYSDLHFKVITFEPMSFDEYLVQKKIDLPLGISDSLRQMEGR